jgi:hypothetical protein
MKWTNNNRACVATWSALLVLDQNSEGFAESENVKIGTFKFWVKGESGELRKSRAMQLATMLDNIMQNFEFAKYEEGSDKPGAINAMCGVLTEDAKTIAELGDVIDDNYFFPSEKTNA